jgi:hypothetical protein
MDGRIEGGARRTGCAASKGEIKELGTCYAAIGSGIGSYLGTESGSAVGDELVHILVVNLRIHLAVDPVLHWVIQIAKVDCWFSSCSISCSCIIGGLVGSRSVWLSISTCRSAVCAAVGGAIGSVCVWKGSNGCISSGCCRT